MEIRGKSFAHKGTLEEETSFNLYCQTRRSGVRTLRLTKMENVKDRNT